ncbi:hypothetical protein ES702_04937 [subsurface metagenome]
MPYYNLTNVTNSSNVWELTDSVNAMSGGWLGIGILITLTIIIFISMKDYPMKEAFAATMFISTIAALLLRVIGIIGDFVMFIYVILTAIAIITLLFNK